MTALPPDGAHGAAQARLEELRRSGRWRADPARFCFLEALARRIPAQPEPVQRVLQARFEARLAQYAADTAADDSPPVARSRAAARASASPLAGLAQLLRDARPAADTAGGDELASARRFREAWDAQRALEKLDLALAQRPAQAGPLNSHALVLQSLELMRAASPRYLRQFVLHVETLQWLAEADELVGAQGRGRKSAGQGGAAARSGRTRQRK